LARACTPKSGDFPDREVIAPAREVREIDRLSPSC
jgi:hypothetical protein